MPWPKRTVEERIWQRIVVVENCWEWAGEVNRDGYGIINVARKVMRAHRASYETFRGPIPTGLTLDHLCRNRRCVNPDHLEAVPLVVNIRRGSNTTRTHCKKGHPLDGRATIRSGPKAGTTKRKCMECIRIGQREWWKEHGDRVRAIRRQKYADSKA